MVSVDSRDSFEQLVGPYRSELHAHCYRILGSSHDADDALQDALLRAWRALPKFEGRSSVRSWLYRITTNSCLRLIERRPRRVLPMDYAPPARAHDEVAAPLAESVWLEPYPDALVADGFASLEARYEQRESIELAFVAALQHLPARQRAVLILREVLGFSGAEVAAQLDTSADAVYTALQRAHKTVDQRLPERSQQATLRSLGDARLNDLVSTYVAAWERGDVDAIVAMLTEDAILAMPPLPSWYTGSAQVSTYLTRVPFTPGYQRRLRLTQANGQLALASYNIPTAGGDAHHALQLLTLSDDGRIATMTAFIGAELEPFGLPTRLPA